MKVEETDCERRRKDLYDKYNALKEDMDKMKGGLIVLGIILPIMIVLLGGYIRWQSVETQKLIAGKTVSAGKATSVEVNETTGKLEPVRETREELPREMSAAPK